MVERALAVVAEASCEASTRTVMLESRNSRLILSSSSNSSLAGGGSGEEPQEATAAMEWVKAMVR